MVTIGHCGVVHGSANCSSTGGVDNHFANTNLGINKTYDDEIGAGRGDINTPNSSLYVIARDPFRAIRRGRATLKTCAPADVAVLQSATTDPGI